MKIREEKQKINKKLKIFYISIIVICIIAVMLAVYIQLYLEDDNSYYSAMTEEQENKAKIEFEKLFTNDIEYSKNNNYKINKIDVNKDLIYTEYHKLETKENSYDINVNIPFINIDNPSVEKINKEIRDIFQTKAENTLNTQNRNIIYTVSFYSHISNNILSLVIRSTLKEGTSAQRDIIKTYNFDLANQEEITVQQILNIKNINEQVANKKIKEEIKKEAKRIDELAQLGYNIYSRDYTNEMYEIKNVTEIFIGKDDIIYIIFAYGNQNETSEMDIIVM